MSRNCYVYSVVSPLIKVVNISYVDSDQRMVCYIKSKERSTKLITELSRFDRGTNYANISTKLVNVSLNSLNYSALTVVLDLFC